MKNFSLPNYKDGSIVNLMSSIAKALGTKTKYNSLKLLSPKELKNSKNIVLILIDGLGYDYLQKYGKESILNKHLRGKITSVFPSATTAAIPIFSTGDSCMNHGLVSWHSFIKEIGTTITCLPYVDRLGKEPVGTYIPIKNLFKLNPLVDKMKIKSYVLYTKEIVNSDFTIASSGKSKRVVYNNLDGFFRQIKKTINIPGKKYIYAYWPKHDSLCHKTGVDTKKVLKNFKEFNKKLEKFLKSIKGTNTKIVITADHGLIDVPMSRKIKLKDHPKLVETLSVPICGDFRYAYCFVKANKKQDFEKYVKTKLKSYCYLYKSEDLVKKGFFGLDKPSKRFLERIGDYTLIMKKNYGIYQNLANEKDKGYHIGEHGGLSKEEMIVPLIIINL